MGRLRETAERITGVAFRPLVEVNYLEESELELRGKNRELQDLAYTVLDYAGGNPQEMKAQERRKLAQRARVIHQQDPQYGGQVNLLNEFVLGRGIPKPPAVDEEVQKVIDRFWADPDNQRIITTHGAQVRFNTDLTLQSNNFPLVYDDGDDGAVKLGLLDHDTVEQAVRDDDARLRVLYYFTKSYRKVWDPKKHAYKVSRERTQLRYYEDFRNLRDAKRDDEEGLRKEPLPAISESLMGRGRVVHVSINRTLEQAFGVPEIARTIRWLTAYNDLMRARVDMAKAAASIIMRRKVKGGAAAMQQLAAQALMSSGGSATAPPDPHAMGQTPRPGVLEENDWVDHQPFTLNSGGAAAEADMRGVRGQLAVGGGWPDPYIGGEGGNLSTATQLELRVLKMVEARQQILEDFITLLVRRAIERAIQVGILDRFRPMTLEEREREAKRVQDEAKAEQALAEPPQEPQLMPGQPQPPVPPQMAPPAFGPSPVAQESRAKVKRRRELREAEVREAGSTTTGIGGGSDDNLDDRIGSVWDVDLTGDDEEQPPEGYVLRELDFSVAMPSPLRRSMVDLVTAVSTIAKTFDPNATNLELSKLLLKIALGEGLEVQDPAAEVERAFPEGYVDPAVQAALAQQPPPIPFEQVPGPVGADGNQHPNPDNPYGVPQQAQPPDVTMQQAAMVLDQLGDRRLVQLHSRVTDRQGRPVPVPIQVQEAILARAAARRIPTVSGRAAVDSIAAGRGQLSDVQADNTLGPALAKALEQVAAGT